VTSLSRRGALAAGLAAGAGSSVQARDDGGLALQIDGAARQSGLLIVRTAPDAAGSFGDLNVRADARGLILLGLDRDAPPRITLTLQGPDGARAARTLEVTPRTYVTRRVDGVPASRINPPDSEAERIAREVALKNRAFASRADVAGFTERFAWPVPATRVTSPWGAQRILNGTAQRPHYGVDIAGPTGTPVRAPASGVVVIAETDLFFEGGMVSIDHGQGLITSYLHMSRVDAAVGQLVTRGTPLGAVGARGRATGPHLCWRMRWRGKQVDPTLHLAA
jgi:murein DD-endopeptidase MepM/ murein hydrolase activator NlpD